MSILAMDLGGTKLAVALLTETGVIRSEEVIPLNQRKGAAVGKLITDQVAKFRDSEGASLQSIGVSVPGISRHKTGTVWAPNIPDWEDYPLLDEIVRVARSVSVSIDSDRACSMLGEQWQGNAKGCNDAIYLAVGTGIGAGILVDGKILRGAHDIAGAIGWMALTKPFDKKYISCGCFEYYTSGEGIARLARERLADTPSYTGGLRHYASEDITAHHIFDAHDQNDVLAVQVIGECIEFWGMAVANLISLFNPEKIIFGGGVFGPAVKFIPAIQIEANRWAQPISRSKVAFEASGLNGNSSIYGAGFLALKSIQSVL